MFRSNSDAERLRIKDNGSATGQFVARAWIYFNGTGTPAIRDSHNVGSITDVGTGYWDINFSTNMANTNYCVVAQSNVTVGWVGSGTNIINQATDKYRHQHQDNNQVMDTPEIRSVVFGD